MIWLKEQFSFRLLLFGIPPLFVVFGLGCSTDGAQLDGSNEPLYTDTSNSGDGSVDINDYTGGEGHFNDEGVWEQPREFCAPPLFPEKNTCEGEAGLWGKALQMALWFFNVNKSGNEVYCTDVQWRGNAHLGDAHIKLQSGVANGVDMSDAYIAKYIDTFDPDGDGAVDLSGGYYDAGDYIKFALPTGYMVSTIAWAMVEFPEAFKESSLEDEALTQIKWAADYFMKNMFVVDKSVLPEKWTVVGYAHQVGSSTDHSCGWMPPELRDPSFCPRPGYFATLENPAADVTANNAAALALVSRVTRDVNREYSEKALNHAIALYHFAQIAPESIASTDGGLYTSESAEDDLAWAAVWLYEATKDEQYLAESVKWMQGANKPDAQCMDEAFKYPHNVTEENHCWTEGWTHVWNSLRSGVYLRLAVSLQEARDEKLRFYAKIFQMISRQDSLSWMKDEYQSPGGFSMKIADTWGSGRYNSAGQLVALAYAKNFPEDDASVDLVAWARGQSRYLLGDNEVNGNPEGKSFMMGFTELSPNYANQPHHAAGHASIFGLPDNPVENRHVIWGALVNGPVAGDTHVDQRGDFGSNEITIDYNAAFVGALAGNFYFKVPEDGGPCPDPSFPPIEEPVDEFYTMGKVDTSNDCRSQVEITMINESVYPPRYNEMLKARYYVNVTELEMAGIPPSTMTAFINYDNGAQSGEQTQLTGPFKCEDEESEEARNMWYFVLSYEGQKFWGRQDLLKGPRVTQIDYGLPNGDSCVWDTTNDWSYDGLGIEASVKTPRITVYGEDSKLLWGEEPPCHAIQHVSVEILSE